MNQSRLQKIIDEFYATSRQQWMFSLSAITLALGAVLAAGAANEKLWPAGLVIVAVLAAASAIRPDSHTALIVIAIVVLHWLVTVDDVGTAWLPVGALSLLGYHSVIALSASLPVGGTVPPETIGQWATNTTLVGVASVGMWIAVAVLDGRDASGNGLLTALALSVAAVAGVWIRSRSLDPSRR